MMLALVAALPVLSGFALVLAVPERRRALAAAAGLVLALVVALAAAVAIADARLAIVWTGALGLHAGLTPLSAVMLVLVPLVALPVTVHAALNEEEPALARLVGLMLVFVGGMELVVMADDLLTLLIGWEVIGAASWALVAHRWRDSHAVSSGAWAFLVTRTGDVGLFLAVMVLFAATGSLGFEALGELAGWPLALAASGLLVSAAAKAGQVPFSPWLFRAMDAPASVSALLHAATLVAAGAYLVARVEPHLAGTGFGDVAIAVGLVTAIAGGVVAMLQNHVKKLLAASTSAQLGLMFVAAGAGYPAVAILHLVAHALYKAPLFLAAGLAHEIRGTYALHRLGLGRSTPLLALAALAPALALAGVPPLGGAWTKEEIVSAAGHASLWLSLLVTLAGGLSAAYATRYQRLAFGRGAETPRDRLPSVAALAPILALSAASLGLAVLWLPAVSERVARWLGGEVPAGTVLELVLSLALVAVGIVFGLALAARAPRLGAEGRSAAFSDWLGLPWLLEHAIARPVQGLAHHLGRIDDRALDALPRAVRDASAAVPQRLAAVDNAVVDGGVRLAAALWRWLARVLDRFGELGAEGLPSGSAFLVGLAGAEARRVQTGFSHHYYVILVAGLLAAVAVLAIGA